jgi:uncharacterized FlaG/YvyC family protein
MSFWNTFVKVWQVRTSIKIQESFEDAYHTAKKSAEFQSNLPDIIEEIDKKNNTWNSKLNFHRNGECDK